MLGRGNAPGLGAQGGEGPGLLGEPQRLGRLHPHQVLEVDRSRLQESDLTGFAATHVFTCAVGWVLEFPQRPMSTTHPVTS